MIILIAYLVGLSMCFIIWEILNRLHNIKEPLNEMIIMFIFWPIFIYVIIIFLLARLTAKMIKKLKAIK